jgi:hypothetical protein
MAGTSRRHNLLLTVVVVAVSGCASAPISLSQARPGERHAYAERGPSTAIVTVIRDSGIQSAACPTEISVDGRPAGTIWPSQAVQLHIPAGEVILGARTTCLGGPVEREARLVAGQRLFFRVAYDHNGSLQFGRTIER